MVDTLKQQIMIETPEQRLAAFMHLAYSMEVLNKELSTVGFLRWWPLHWKRNKISKLLAAITTQIEESEDEMRALMLMLVALRNGHMSLAGVEVELQAFATKVLANTHPDALAFFNKIVVEQNLDQIKEQQ